MEMVMTMEMTICSSGLLLKTKKGNCVHGSIESILFCVQINAACVVVVVLMI